MTANVAAVQWDREKPRDRLKNQEELLREYLTHHLYAYSPFYRRRFSAAGLMPRNMGGFADLTRLEPTRWSEVVAEPAAFLLRPTERAIARFGDRRLVVAIARAKMRGRVAQLNRDVIDPAYKPIHWHLVGDVPVGYSAEDLDRLAEAGRRVVQLAGLTRDDVIVGVTRAGPNLEHWQLVDGARLAGLSAVHLGPDASLDRVEAAAPTVLAGPPDVLERVLGEFGSARRRLFGLRTLLSLGTVLDSETRSGLEKLGRSVGEKDLAVVAAWAPPGVQALWGECRGGQAFHTYPDLEWIEVLPGEGEVAWSSLAWHGTAFMRLRTGISGTIDDTTCEVCGRIGPRLTLAAVPAAPPAPTPAVTPATPAPTPAPAAPAPPASAPPVVTPTVAAARPPSPAEIGFMPKPERGVKPPVPEPEPEPEPELASTVAASELLILDEHPGVAVWQAEYRRVNGEDELIVFVAPAGVDRLGPLFRELDASLQATQYVVLRPEQLRERVIRQGAVLDLRPSSSPPGGTGG